MEIHKLNSDEWQILKTLLLDSVKEIPDAFSAAPNEDLPDHEWRGLANKYSTGQEKLHTP